jgi:outer membrane protein, adhesin transport system
VLFGAALIAASALHGPTLLACNGVALDDLTQLLAEHEEVENFRAAIAQGIAENPLIAQRRANVAEAQAAKREAQSAVFPTIDLAVSANRAIAREFSNDPDNVIERSRGPGRADVSAAVNQTLYDFGAAGRRIVAASARMDAAKADVDAAYDEIALRAIGAWIDVAAYARLAALADDHLAAQSAYRTMLQSRIDQGVSAPADHARLDAAIAISDQRAARFRQELGNAEARYREIFGAEALLPLKRPPLFVLTDADLEDIILASQNTAPVRSAKAQARGAQEDARAARSDTLPSVGVGLDAGRFGIFEPGRNDYDVRARVVLRYRFLGPGGARADQAAARASAALSRSDAIFREAEREARIAASDVTTLSQSSEAFDAEYRASKVTRDAEVARFRIARGTMFDVLAAEDRYFASAVSYLRSASELDAARYVLLARVGILISELGIKPDYSWQDKQ